MDPVTGLLFTRPWAIEPAHGSAFVEMISAAYAAHAAGGQGHAKATRPPTPEINGVRVLTMSGPMLHKPPAWLADFGVEHVDTLALAGQVTAANADPTVSSILIHADTPGGQVAGTHELHDAIASSSKPVHVHVNGVLASAAVWATAAADKITATKGSSIGAVGVYKVLVDRSKALENNGIQLHLISSGGVKGAGADGRVTQDMKADEARIVAQHRDAFVEALSAGRGRDMSARATGQMWLAPDALRIGLIDRVVGERPTSQTVDRVAPNQPAAPRVTPSQITRAEYDRNPAAFAADICAGDLLVVG